MGTGKWLGGEIHVKCAYGWQRRVQQSCFCFLLCFVGSGLAGRLRRVFHLWSQCAVVKVLVFCCLDKKCSYNPLYALHML